MINLFRTLGFPLRAVSAVVVLAIVYLPMVFMSLFMPRLLEAMKPDFFKPNALGQNRGVQLMNEATIQKCSHGVYGIDEQGKARYCTVCTPYEVSGDVPVISDFQEIKYTKEASELLEGK